MESAAVTVPRTGFGPGKCVMMQKFLLSLPLVFCCWVAGAWAQDIQISPTNEEENTGRQVQNLIQQITNQRGSLLVPNTATHQQNPAKTIYAEPPLGRLTPPPIFFGGLPRVVDKSG